MRAVPQWVPELLTRDPIDLVAETFSQAPEEGVAALFRLHLLDAYAGVRHSAPAAIDDPLLRFMVRASDESDVSTVDGGDVIWNGMFETLRTESPDEFIDRCNSLFSLAFKWDFVPVYAWVYERADGETVRRFPELRQELARATAALQSHASGAEQRKSSGKEGGCYIATAVYGSYDASEVVLLRTFRDERLAPYRVGRALIRLYYAVSPAMAAYLGRVAFLRRAARALLDPIVAALALRSSERDS